VVAFFGKNAGGCVQDLGPPLRRKFLESRLHRFPRHGERALSL
jgi:hypothetical protein